MAIAYITIIDNQHYLNVMADNKHYRFDVDLTVLARLTAECSIRICDAKDVFFRNVNQKQ